VLSYIPFVYFITFSIIRKTIVRNSPSNHLSLDASYNNIGAVYNNMGEHSKALLFYEKGLEICQKTLPLSHPSLAIFYSNIAAVYYQMGGCSKALSVF